MPCAECACALCVNRRLDTVLDVLWTSAQHGPEQSADSVSERLSTQRSQCHFVTCDFCRETVNNINHNLKGDQI